MFTLAALFSQTQFIIDLTYHLSYRFLSTSNWRANYGKEFITRDECFVNIRWRDENQPLDLLQWQLYVLLSANTGYYTRDLWFYADLIVWLVGNWFINEIKKSFRQHKCELDSLLFGRFFLMPNRRKSSSEFSSLYTGRIKIFTSTRFQRNVDESMTINRISIGRTALMFSFYFKLNINVYIS